MHLRTPIPTLEPDDAFVARLSALAAAGAPVERRSPLATWRVALAAAGVAAILVGVAWLAGLNPTGSPQPAPGPATTPSAPESTNPSATRSPSSSAPDSTLFEPGSAPVGSGPTATGDTDTAVPPTRGEGAQGNPGHQGNQANPGNQGNPNPQNPQNPQNQQGQQGQQGQGGSRGPNENAGDHPNEHAITKSNNGHPPDGDRPVRGPKKQEGDGQR